ncbi:acyl carrier protein [Taklimakanibacter lacteus]|uniref:acyl carrier protein n=1 Tax=Taklimakanibacter lacteus TaxID=2268456 RepID=UPI000E661C0B
MQSDAAKAAILDVLKELELLNDKAEMPDIEFASLSIDSIKVVDLCVALEERFGREVSIEELVENPTVNQLAAHLAKVAAVRQV